MRTTYRIVTTAVAVAAAIPFGNVGTANAGTTLTEAPAAAAYFSSTTPEKTDAMPHDPGPDFNKLNTDNVAQGNLAVAVVEPNKSDKESFLRWDLQPIMDLVYRGKEVTITSAVVTVPLQPDDNVNRSVSPAPNKVKVCASGPEGFSDIDAGAYDEKPTPNCGQLNNVAVASADGKAYQFNIFQIAQRWASGEINDGVALIPAEASSPFQVVFAKAADVKLAVTYDVADATVVTPPVPTTAPLPPVTQPNVPTYVPPVNSGTVNQPVVPVAPQPAPSAVPRPTAAPPVRQITPIAGNSLVENNRPSAAFWLGALAGVGLIGAMSLFLGTTEVPETTSTTQNGVGRALAGRRRGGPAGVRTAARPIRTA